MMTIIKDGTQYITILHVALYNNQNTIGHLQYMYILQFKLFKYIIIWYNSTLVRFTSKCNSVYAYVSERETTMSKAFKLKFYSSIMSLYSLWPIVFFCFKLFSQYKTTLN